MKQLDDHPIGDMKMTDHKIPECPAYEMCRAKKASCEICEGLPVDEWREHVKRVMDKA